MNLLKQIKHTYNTGGKYLIPVCIVLAMVLATCSNKKPETLITTLENNQENIQENQILQLSEADNSEADKNELPTSIEDPNAGVSQTSGDNDFFLEDQDSLDIPANLLARIKRNLLAENYPAVLDLVNGRDDDASTYYRGIAYFVMMQEQHKYSSSERVNFADQAETILQDVGSRTSYAGLKARALLWYAVTLQAQYRDYRTLKTAVNTLYRVSKSKTARVNNDAIHYLGNVHAKMGWYGPARYYYKKVNGLNQNGDDLIYDYTDKAHYNTSQASEAGLARLRSYMNGTHADYK